MISREENIEWLLSAAEKANLTKNMIDPYINLARKLFPGATEATIKSYATTVLRMRRLNPQPSQTGGDRL
jgi:hypothetical protein